jgi:hypothetical protein
MHDMISAQYDPWPALPYAEFKSTQHLLHRFVQVLGKVKLTTPFEPHWSNVALWITSRGITTGPVPYHQGVFSIDVDFITHQVICNTSWESMEYFALGSMSVAHLTHSLFAALHNLGIDITINMVPQEVPDPVEFDKDTETREYRPDLANAWWRILISSYSVMQRYHSRFYGITPAIGLMWGTFDLRDARYKGLHLATEGINSGYIRRNAMDDAQVEAGWWSGNEQYPRPAYFSFIYPEPTGIDQVKIKPDQARWDNTLREFIIDYDDIRLSSDPAQALLSFFESSYLAEARKAGWESDLIVSGEPV